MTGYTLSTDFPTKNQYQTDQGGTDAFVTKIDTTLNGAASLVYSTYLGGGSLDYGVGIAVDDSGNAYVTGYTDSTDFPTKNQYQTNQGSTDAFVTKINTGLSGGLVYSTYLGGGDDDRGLSIAADNSGNAYVTGYTDSTDFPTKNQYQTNQGSTDAFVTKINTGLSGGLVYSTYLGGGDDDRGLSIAADNSGNAYVTGYTDSTDFPTKNQYQTNQGSTDAFVTKINTGLSGGFSLLYSTYLGGEADDKGRGIAVDNSGNAYVTGYTLSPDFPIKNQYQTYQVGYDTFVAKINTGLSGGLVYSTYLGGGKRRQGSGHSG